MASSKRALKIQISLLKVNAKSGLTLSLKVLINRGLRRWWPGDPQENILVKMDVGQGKIGRPHLFLSDKRFQMAANLTFGAGKEEIFPVRNITGMDNPSLEFTPDEILVLCETV
jgi:hypothetical protein